MTPSEAAARFLTFYRGRYRVLLSFGPAGYDASRHGPFTVNRYRDMGDFRDMEPAPWYPAGDRSFHEHSELVMAASRAKGGVDYAAECRKLELIGVLLIDPGVVRVPERNDPRVSLETEIGLREHFGIKDDELALVLVGKDSREYARYKPPAIQDDILAYLATLDDEQDVRVR